MTLLFIANSILLGVGLAMDAFSVSVAHGLTDPDMKKSRALEIAGLFGGFQALMPLLGYACLNTVVRLFHVMKKLIPWIAFIFLSYIGVMMLVEAFKMGEEGDGNITGKGSLLVQAVATSIDAFAAGAAFVKYDVKMALCASLIIAVVTFVICLCGVLIGKKLGLRFAKYARAAGGIILILIGIENLIS